MGARIKYSFGDILNEETGTQFLEEIFVEKGKSRKARCKCGYCGNENFIITIKKAKLVNFVLYVEVKELPATIYKIRAWSNFK